MELILSIVIAIIIVIATFLGYKYYRGDRNTIRLSGVRMKDFTEEEQDELYDSLSKLWNSAYKIGGNSKETEKMYRIFIKGMSEKIKSRRNIPHE